MAPTKATKTGTTGTVRNTTTGHHRTTDVAPGHVDFDWRSIYHDDVPLKRYEDPSGTVVCFPPFPTPDQGDIFADLLEGIPDQVMLLRLIRQAMTENAKDAEAGLRTMARAFRGGGKLEDISELLTFWAGVDVPK
jgi:hypothetical protein